LIDITPGDTWANVASGATDPELIAQAAGLKSFGYPVMVTFDHEADARIGQSGTPAEFVAAWQHVNDVYAAQGVTNVIWVWALTGYGFWTPSKASSMYPGDAYVDWVAADSYDWYPGRAGTKWVSFQQTFQPFVTWVAANAPDKPMMAEETG